MGIKLFHVQKRHCHPENIDVKVGHRVELQHDNKKVLERIGCLPLVVVVPRERATCSRGVQQTHHNGDQPATDQKYPQLAGAQCLDFAIEKVVQHPVGNNA